jgi:hypothetical protein
MDLRKMGCGGVDWIEWRRSVEVLFQQDWPFRSTEGSQSGM